jgi:hypothetical protein
MTSILFIHYIVFLTTCPQPLPQRGLHRGRSRVSSIRFQYLIFSLMMSDSFSLILPRLPVHYTECFKKSFTTLKAYRNLYRGHTQGFELSKCSKPHLVLHRIVIRNCFDLFLRFLLHGTSPVTVHRPGKRVLRFSRTSPR